MRGKNLVPPLFFEKAGDNKIYVIQIVGSDIGKVCFMSGQPGFTCTCWISFAPVFSFITVESLSLLYLIFIS